MTMRGREFVTVARELVLRPTEAHWRAASGRAYYGLLLSLRDAMMNWGLSRPMPSQVHQLVYRRLFVPTDGDTKQIGIWFDQLRAARARADYEAGTLAEFATNAGAKWAVQTADDTLRLLDMIEVDPRRRHTITAEIKAVLP
jgi:hypothetical protein